MEKYLHIGIPEGEEEEQGIENLFEKVMENSHNLMREEGTQDQEAERVPIKRYALGSQRGALQDTS